MLNPSMFIKPSHPNITTPKKIELEKLSGQICQQISIQRTRWDEPIDVPPILYQKLKVPPPSTVSQSLKQVTNNYPPSLIEFIRRSYNRCKDQQQKKLMEVEVRNVIQKNSASMHAINWDTFPLPNVSTSANQAQRHGHLAQQYTTPSYPSTSIAYGPQGIFSKPIQKQTLYIPSTLQNQSLLDKIQKQSNQTQAKTKQIISKRLQQLQQKFNRSAENNTDNQPPEKTFIGFKDQRQVKIEMHKQRYEQIAQRNKIQPQTQPVSPAQKLPPSQLISQPSKPSVIQAQSLQVVQSKLPQKVYPVKPLPQTVKKPAQTTTKTSQITKQQLANIVRAGKQEDLRTVAKRFSQFNKIKPVKHVQVQEQDSQQEMDYKIVGKCLKIDKPYLRITHRPDPQTVRPETILRKAFNHYKAEYSKNTPYDMIISQFRSIRQDLTVQNIRNSFTVQVYEENFKMSLFEDDTIMMKQCQTNLWQLYRQGLYNKRSERTKFISYHFICMILQERYKELEYMLTQIPPEVLEEKQVQESLKLKRFLVIGNYHAFFTFYNSQQDKTCQKLMNHYIDKVRVKFLVMACKTFGPKISLTFLGQNCAEDQDVLEALAKEEGGTVNESGELLLKQSYEKLKNSEYLQVKKVTNLLD